MEEFFSNIINGAQNLHWTESWAVIFGTIYIILVLRENVWCWFWGILSCSLWAWSSFNLYNLYIDAILNIFYVLMGFVGIYQWKFGGKENEALPITQLSINQHVMIIFGGLVLTIIFGFVFEKYTAAEKTYLDSFTTAFAVFATFMTIQKKLDNWIYWIIVDVLYVYIYGMQGAVLFMVLYVVYCIIAIRGFFEWRRSVVKVKS